VRGKKREDILQPEERKRPGRREGENERTDNPSSGKKKKGEHKTTYRSKKEEDEKFANSL